MSTWPPPALIEPSPIDADRAALAWADSGCQAITHPGVDVPGRLVAGVTALVAALDAAGAGLADAYAGGGLGLLAERAAALMLRPSGRTSCGGASRLIPAADGWIAATLARTEDRELLPAWLGIESTGTWRSDVGAAWVRVERAAADRQAHELVGLGALLGLACARVGEVDSDRPLALELTGHRRPRRLEGLRVLNLGSLWAAPLCAHLLASIGADVVTVESVSRPDGARTTPAWFDAIHAGQRSVALDFRQPGDGARLGAIVAAADVVIEGSRPRALAQLGIDARALVTHGRPALWVSLTGHGRTGEAATRVGMGDDAAAAGALVGSVNGAPVFLADAIADPLSGLVAAVAIVELIGSESRALVDVALSRVAGWLRDRPGDPVIAPRHAAALPTARPAGARPFVLGADTEEVCRDWLAPGPVAPN